MFLQGCSALSAGTPPSPRGYMKLDGNGEGAAGSWPSADLLPSAARGSHHGNNVPKEQLPGERGRLGDSPGAQGMMDEPLGEGGQSHSCTVVSKKGGGCWGTMMGLRPPPPAPRCEAGALHHVPAVTPRASPSPSGTSGACTAPPCLKVTSTRCGPDVWKGGFMHPPPPQPSSAPLHVVLSAELGVLPSCVTAKSWRGCWGAATCPLA